MSTPVKKKSYEASSKSSTQTRRVSILVDGRNSPARCASQAPRRAVQVLDDDGKDVTPLPLYHAEPGDTPGRFILDEIYSSSGTGASKSPPGYSVPSSSPVTDSSRLSSLSIKAPLTKKTNAPKLDAPINPPGPCADNLDEVVDIWLSETDTISLLDIPPTIVSEDADNAEAIKERNVHYSELCKNIMHSDSYVERSVQTFEGAPKNKKIQSDQIVMVDKGTMATIWDIYDSFCDQNKTSEGENVDYPQSTVNTAEFQEMRGDMSSCSTAGTGCTSGSRVSLLTTGTCGDGLNTELDPQLIMLSESFQHSLLIMERNIVRNIFLPKLAAYRQLPILEDPDSTVRPGTEEQSEEGAESSSSPTLERLWAFSCELTKGCNITSMVWNKENPDILAVGYGGCDSSNQKPGLICCWSLRNITRPERFFQCRSCVTSLDFSANNPGQLAVGMYDGTVAIYNVQRTEDACVVDSSECFKRHLHPVWQVCWTKQEMTLSGEDRVEALISVSADGRIAKWFLTNDGLDCIDLMTLNRVKKKGAWKKKMTHGLCFDTHPTDYSIYLTGTSDGFIHQCSFSERQDFLKSYQNHFCPVNHIEWSPFNPDVFLSCSSDWTVQLWKQDLFTPVLSFTSLQEAVHDVRWSPNWSTIFAAINGRQVEIWDLSSDILLPTMVHHAAPGVKLTSLLFARGTDCVLVGDSDGQVTVYQLNNLNVGEGKQVDGLDDIIRAAVSRQTQT